MPIRLGMLLYRVTKPLQTTIDLNQLLWSHVPTARSIELQTKQQLHQWIHSKKGPSPKVWGAHGYFLEWNSKPNAWVSHNPIRIKAQSPLFPTLMILELIESEPQIQWFTHEILWNKAQVWNSQSIELMSLSTCSKIVLKIDKRACFTKAVKSPTSLLQGPQELSLIVEGSIQRKLAQFVHH